MNDTLHVLQSQEEVKYLSQALLVLDRMLDQIEDPDEEYLEEIRFDFFMEDGIQTISKVIRRDDMAYSDIQRGLNLLFRVAEENACHWQCIWESMGEREGLIQFLEAHCWHEEIFTSALNLCRKISTFQLLRVEPKDILRWMPLWDLILCGIECYIDRSDVIFFFFCHFLESHEETLIPVEMHNRIGFALIRGLAALQQSDTDYEFQKLTFARIISRYTQDGKRRQNSNQTDCCMFIPCSAAA